MRKLEIQTWFAAFTLASALICSCSHEEKVDGASFQPRLIKDYYEVQKVTVAQSEANRATVKFDGNTITSTYRADEYERLSGYYHDQNYNVTRVPGWDNSALADSVMTVDVTTLSDFDKTHPANSSMADAVTLRWASASEYILNGYKAKKGSTTTEGGFMDSSYETLTSYTSLLKDVDGRKGGMRLLFPFCYLTFNTTPETKGSHDFLLKIKMAGQSSEITGRFTMTFK